MQVLRERCPFPLSLCDSGMRQHQIYVAWQFIWGDHRLHEKHWVHCPLMQASWADASPIECVPRMSTTAEPMVFLLGDQPQSGQRIRGPESWLSSSSSSRSKTVDFAASFMRLMFSSDKEPILNLSDFHGVRTLLVIISDMIDPGAHGITPHEPSVIRLQEFRYGSHILHSRIKPQIVRAGIENHRHSAVNSSGHGVGSGGENRARLYPISSWVFPAIPDSRKGK